MSKIVAKLFKEIDKLINVQNTRFPHLSDPSSLSQLDENDQNEFLEIQFKINQLFQLIQSSRQRALSQLVYNEVMKDNCQIDARKSLEMKDYVMITFNPQSSIQPNEVYSATKRFMESYVVEYGLYCLEQRSAEPHVYHGFHSHMLFKRKEKPSRVHAEIDRLLRPYCGTDLSVKIKSTHTPEEVVNFIRYMAGHKQDVSKLPKVTNDSNYRQDFGFEKIYTVREGFPTCWNPELSSLKLLKEKSSL